MSESAGFNNDVVESESTTTFDSPQEINPSSDSIQTDTEHFSSLLNTEYTIIESNSNMESNSDCPEQPTENSEQVLDTNPIETQCTVSQYSSALPQEDTKLLSDHEHLDSTAHSMDVDVISQSGGDSIDLESSEFNDISDNGRCQEIQDLGNESELHPSTHQHERQFDSDYLDDSSEQNNTSLDTVRETEIYPVEQSFSSTVDLEVNSDHVTEDNEHMMGSSNDSLLETIKPVQSEELLVPTEMGNTTDTPSEDAVSETETVPAQFIEARDEELQQKPVDYSPKQLSAPVLEFHVLEEEHADEPESIMEFENTDPIDQATEVKDITDASETQFNLSEAADVSVNPLQHDVKEFDNDFQLQSLTTSDVQPESNHEENLAGGIISGYVINEQDAVPESTMQEHEQVMCETPYQAEELILNDVQDVAEEFDTELHTSDIKLVEQPQDESQFCAQNLISNDDQSEVQEFEHEIDMRVSAPKEVEHDKYINQYWAQESIVHDPESEVEEFEHSIPSHESIVSPVEPTKLELSEHSVSQKILSNANDFDNDVNSKMTPATDLKSKQSGELFEDKELAPYNKQVEAKPFESDTEFNTSRLQDDELEPVVKHSFAQEDTLQEIHSEAEEFDHEPDDVQSIKLEHVEEIYHADITNRPPIFQSHEKVIPHTSVSHIESSGLENVLPIALEQACEVPVTGFAEVSEFDEYTKGKNVRQSSELHFANQEKAVIMGQDLANGHNIIYEKPAGSESTANLSLHNEMMDSVVEFSKPVGEYPNGLEDDVESLNIDDDDEEKMDEEKKAKIDFDRRYAELLAKYTSVDRVNKALEHSRQTKTLDRNYYSNGNDARWSQVLDASDRKKRSVTLERNESKRKRRPLPKPAINDDYLYPDSVTPSKVDQGLSMKSLEDGMPKGTYNVPYIDDDAFLPRKFRQSQNGCTDSDDASSLSFDVDGWTWDPRLVKYNTLDPNHIADTNECVPTPEIIKKGRVKHTSSKPDMIDSGDNDSGRKRKRFNFCGCVGRRSRK